MKPSERAWRIGRDVAGVLPRAHAALRSERVESAVAEWYSPSR